MTSVAAAVSGLPGVATANAAGPLALRTDAHRTTFRSWGHGRSLTTELASIQLVRIFKVWEIVRLRR
jgi:hypothetical protein